MRRLLSLFGLFLYVLQSHAQELKPIEPIGSAYYQYDVRLRVKTIKDIVKPYPLAYQQVKSGRSFRTWSVILTGVSVGTIAEGVSELSSGENKSSTNSSVNPGVSIGFGIAGVVGGIVLWVVGSKHIAMGVNTYNSAIKTKSSPNSFSLNLGLSNHGVRLIVRF
jgi:hypothetical protein